MYANRFAVVGIGATGTVLAAALLSKYPDTFLIGRTPDLSKKLSLRGINISGEITYHVPAKNCSSQIGDLKDFSPAAIFLATKTFHLEHVIDSLQEVYVPGVKIISTQNGLGPEDLIADKFGPESIFRMSLNYGVSLKGAGEAEVTFFNRPNHLGGLTRNKTDFGAQVADTLTDCGLDTEFVDDIKLFVWKKMIMKCTMASMLGYLQKVGIHKDSMCNDILNRTPTEIDFLGAKVVEYARAKGISTPFYVTMTNLVKAIENKYLDH
jgi:2-dehydropantoate 2-reductase